MRRCGGDGARSVALLYLFGSGGGQALCPLVTYLMDVGGVPSNLLWRWILVESMFDSDPILEVTRCHKSIQVRVLVGDIVRQKSAG